MTTRRIVNIPKPYHDRMRHIAAMDEVSFGAVLRHAVGVYLWLREEAEGGKVVLLEDPRTGDLSRLNMGEIAGWEPKSP